MIVVGALLLFGGAFSWMLGGGTSDYDASFSEVFAFSTPGKIIKEPHLLGLLVLVGCLL